MKKPLGVLLLLLLSIFALAALTNRKTEAAQNLVAAVRTPVIVELFTSEGCSSCPPADILLAKLEQLQPVDGAEVIALEEHVDYWNHFGWADPFSSSEFTTRQHDYADVFYLNSMYTPEMVIDGSKELIGSHNRDVRITIAEAARQPKLEVKLEQNLPAKENELRFTLSTGKLNQQLKDRKVDIWIAVTERGLHSDVKRGENAGQNLHHAAVVRALREIGTAESGQETSFSGSAILPLDRSWNRQNLRIVAFVQERSSKQIVGAASAAIN
jgi:hypothetical protein